MSLLRFSFGMFRVSTIRAEKFVQANSLTGNPGNWHKDGLALYTCVPVDFQLVHNSFDAIQAFQSFLSYLLLEKRRNTSVKHYNSRIFLAEDFVAVQVWIGTDC